MPKQSEEPTLSVQAEEPELVASPGYAPLAGEPAPELKALSAEVLQAIGTYDAGGGSVEAAHARVGDLAPDTVVQQASSLLQPTAASTIDVVYPQLSGLTQQSAGIMAIYRQRLLEAGQQRSVTRVADMRFVRTPQGWALSEIISFGGEPATNADPSPVAIEVLNNDRIRMPDSARWDVQSGVVEDRVLRLLLDLAQDHILDVTVFATGHPHNVFATDWTSNHTVGRAVDIWAVDDVAVVSQREEGGPLHQLVQSLLERGVTELGSPWDLDGPGVGASFTNTVHQDHLHIAFD